MSGLFESCNTVADAWLCAVAHRSVAAAVAMLVVGGVLCLLRQRGSAHAPSYLILFPALLLVVPVERLLPDAWPTPLPAVVADAMPPGEPAEFPVTPQPHDGSSGSLGSHPMGGIPDHAPSSDPRPHAGVRPVPTWSSYLFLVWVSVLLVGAASLGYRHLTTERRLRRYGLAPEPGLQERFDRLCSDRGFDGPIELRVVPGLPSPVASGIVRRSVCLPPGLDGSLSDAQLRFVLLHELEHHARRDVPIEALLQLVRLAFWFHPVAWLVPALHRRWREFACDEAAVARCGSRRRTAAADALFTLIHLASDVPHPSGTLASFALTPNIMKTRLTRILDRSRAPRRGLSATGFAMLATAGIGAITVARAQQSPTPQAPVKVDVRVPGDRTSATPTPKPDGEVAIAVDQGIAWLLKTQRENGSWGLGAAVSKPRDHNVAHQTGLALRALLHGWKGPRHHAIVRAVERGDDYLKANQTDKGLFGPEGAMTDHYGHAQVLRALCAIQHVIPEPQRLEAIERGIAFAERVRNPYSGWRYMPRSGDNDSKHTALMLLAFHDAAELGIELPPNTMQCARELLKQLTADSGRTGFVRAGEPMSRFVVKVKQFPKVYSEEPTAMRMLVEAAFDDDEVDVRLQAKAANLLREMPPSWDREAGSIDYAYWCFGARAMAAYGGEHADVWRRELHQALLGSRVVDGHVAHWPAVDAWSYEGMEAYATASAVLALCALP